MTLSSAIETARSSLAASGIVSATISKNIGAANQIGYNRRVADISSSAQARSISVNVQRVLSDALQSVSMEAKSNSSRADVVLSALTRLSEAAGDPSKSDTIAASIGTLGDALHSYATSPGDASLGLSALQQASNVTAKLGQQSAAVDQVRQQADADIKGSVETINDLLQQFKTANDEIVAATASGGSAPDAADQRDRILASVSNEIGVVARPQSDGGLALYTDSGITLFVRAPRTVTFEASPALSDGETGKSVFIDGVDATSARSPMSLKSGRLAGLMEVRDQIAPTYQRQLDETAGALIRAFKQSDQSSTGAPDRTGLFTWPGAPSLPGPTDVVGLAANARIDPSVDPNQRGDITLLRDGGIGAAGDLRYIYNTAKTDGYSARLTQLQDALSIKSVFGPDTGLQSSQSILEFSQSSTGWLAQGVQTATTHDDSYRAVADSAAQSLASQTGVNVDDEVIKMLQTQHSYEASAKILSTVQGMLDSLLQLLH